jgi:hypothetical protein
MPQRKNPDIPVRVAVAACSWPGATAQQVEQFVTRPIEDAVAENKTTHPGTAADYGIRSVSIPGYAFVYVQLAEDVSDVKRQFSDINLKLNALNSQLPTGASPIVFQSDFGDTAALMLTIASQSGLRRIDIRSRGFNRLFDNAGRQNTTSKVRRLLSSTRFLNRFPRTRQYRTPRSSSSNRQSKQESPWRPVNPGQRFCCSRWRLDRRRRFDPELHPGFLSEAIAAIRVAS